MIRNKRLGAAVSVAILTGTVLASGPTAAASAAPEQRTVTFQFPENARKQIPLVQAASTIRQEIKRHDYPGYAGIEIEDEQVAVWWKGRPPAAIERVIAAASSIAPVRVAAAKHSLRELRAAGAKLSVSYAASQPRIKYAVDGSKVVVATSGAATKGIAGFAQQQRPDVEVPVEFVDQGAKVLTSRRDDWSPWKGGADQINGNSRCTTGFAVRNGNNERFILTAGHCGSNGNQIRDGAGEFMGTFTADNDGHDIALIRPQGNVDNLMYVGGLDSNSVTTVVGYGDVFPGEYLCQSGGTSAREIGGPVCGLRVERFNNNSGDAIEARQVDGRPAVRGGDSGGPVYGPAANGGVIAKGINNYTYIGNDTILGFQDFVTAARDYGIWIVE